MIRRLDVTGPVAVTVLVLLLVVVGLAAGWGMGAFYGSMTLAIGASVIGVVLREQRHC